MNSTDTAENSSALHWRGSLAAAAIAFAAYFCMYAFRKPLTANDYEGIFFLGGALKLKSALVISQVLGYALSKFVGVKFCSEVTRERRAFWLVGLILWAELALVAFGAVPGDWKVAAIFFNGLPLGMIWGLVVRYLEGRKSSDFLLAALCCSFIISTGIVKDAGKAWLRVGVDPFWMPAITGASFFIPFLFAVWLLERLPEPSLGDREQRTERKSMRRDERTLFLRNFWIGLVPLFVFYAVLAAFRDFRDNFSKELLDELGYSEVPGIFTAVEAPTAFIVTGLLAALILIKNHRTSLWAIFGTMIAGALVVGLTTVGYLFGQLDGLSWMIMIGLGGYLAYVPYNAVLFERLLACTRSVGTAVFGIYIADSFGYVGSILVLLYKDVLAPKTTQIDFFVNFSWVLAAVGVVSLVTSGYFFLRLPSSAGSSAVVDSGPDETSAVDDAQATQVV
ncbi:DUF5690 family protein [Blastopirellula retiformator]|nr:DUF5690 family protein [Blastopirellula retiformator]